MWSTLFPCQDPLFPLDWPFITQHAVQTMRQQKVDTKNWMHWKGDKVPIRDAERAERWLLMICDETSHETQKHDSNRNPVPHSPTHLCTACLTYLCSFTHSMKIKPSATKVQGAKGKKERSWSVTSCHPFMCFRQCVKSEKSLCGKIQSFLLYCLFIASVLSLCWDWKIKCGLAILKPYI